MAKRKLLKLENVRCVFPSLASPKAFEGQSEAQAKYGIKVLVPKDDAETLKKIKDFVKEAIGDVAEWNATIKKEVLKVAFHQDPSNDNCVIKDGDQVNKKRVEIDEKDPVDAYTGCIVIGANRGQKMGAPGVYDQANNKMEVGLIEGSILSGYWVNIAVSPYCYSKPKKGFTFTLQAVQLVKPDAVFGAESPFDAVETEDTFDDNTDVFSDE